MLTSKQRAEFRSQARKALPMLSLLKLKICSPQENW